MTLSPTSILMTVTLLSWLLLGMMPYGSSLLAQALESAPSSTTSTSTSPAEVKPEAAAESPGAAKKLEQIESTYQLNLRKIHAPILSDYLTRLEALKNQLQAQGRQGHADQVIAEINKIRQLTTTTGVLPLLPANGENTIPAEVNSGELATLALRASDAETNASKLNALPLGNVSWKVESMPGGLYDVMLIYAAEKLPQDEFITFSIGTHQLANTLRAEQATGNLDTFRITKLGRILITGNLVDTTATIQNAALQNHHLFISNVLLVPSANQGKPF